MEFDQFTKGTEVEVFSDESELRGALFSATVLRGVSKKKQIFVEYKTLIKDEKTKKPLREFVNAVNVRPTPPREVDRRFEVSDVVDAFHDDGWWEGVVIKVENGRYSVYFRGSKEMIDFGKDDLRLHREWKYDSWDPPMEEQQRTQKEHREEEDEKEEEGEKENMPCDMETDKDGNSHKVEIIKNGNSPKLPVEYNEGMFVEASSDEEGFIGAWFSAKIVAAIGEDKYLVEYQTLYTEDEGETKLLREEVDTLHIRPPPPIIQVDSFNLLEEVDAMYHDGWWVGVISKVVVSGEKYFVYFRESKEEYEFGQSDLRPHQDWIDGKWVSLSQAIHQ